MLPQPHCCDQARDDGLSARHNSTTKASERPSARTEGPWFFRRVPPMRGMLVGTGAVPSAAMAGGGDGGGVYPSPDGPLDGEGGLLWLAPLAAAARRIASRTASTSDGNPLMTADRPQTDRVLGKQRTQGELLRSNQSA